MRESVLFFWFFSKKCIAPFQFFFFCVQYQVASNRSIYHTNLLWYIVACCFHTQHTHQSSGFIGSLVVQYFCLYRAIHEIIVKLILENNLESFFCLVFFVWFFLFGLVFGGSSADLMHAFINIFDQLATNKCCKCRVCIENRKVIR